MSVSVSWKFVATLLLLGSTTAAGAHAFLESAAPRVGSTVATAPDQVVLTFTQAVQPSVSNVEVTDLSGAHVEADTPHGLSTSNTRLAIGLGKLSAGPYTVSWHVVSTDGHKSQGKFRFIVAH